MREINNFYLCSCWEDVARIEKAFPISFLYLRSLCWGEAWEKNQQKIININPWMDLNSWNENRNQTSRYWQRAASVINCDRKNQASQSLEQRLDAWQISHDNKLHRALPRLTSKRFLLYDPSVVVKSTKGEFYVSESIENYTEFLSHSRRDPHRD